jgi:glycosyltransferase involved in cell wall biosynthesis
MDFSIVIPTRDRPAQIDACIEALKVADAIDSKWEVVVVDDGSRSPVTLAGLDTGPWSEFRVLRESGRGAAAARNAGAAIAEGRVLLFMDDDCRAEPELLVELEKFCEHDLEALAGGRIIHGCPNNTWSTVTHSITVAIYAVEDRHDRRPRRFSTSILIVPRERFTQLGGFDENFIVPGGEDFDFCERWQDQGGTARYVPSIAVRHYHPLTLIQFFRQQRAYGSGSMRCHLNGRRRHNQRSLASKLVDVGRMAVHAFRSHPPHRAALVSSGFMLAQLFNACGAVGELARGRPEVAANRVEEHR